MLKLHSDKIAASEASAHSMPTTLSCLQQEQMSEVVESGISMPSPVVSGQIISTPSQSGSKLTQTEFVSNINNPRKALAKAESIYKWLKELHQEGERRPSISIGITHLLDHSKPGFALAGMGFIGTGGVVLANAVKVPQNFNVPIWGVPTILIGTSVAFWIGSKMTAHKGFQKFKERFAPGRAEAEKIYDGILSINDEVQRKERLLETIGRFERRVEVLQQLVDRTGISTKKAHKIPQRVLGPDLTAEKTLLRPAGNSSINGESKNTDM